MVSNTKLKVFNFIGPSYYSLDNLININHLVHKKIKVDKKSYKDILTYYIEYEASYGVKPLYIAFIR